MTRKKILIVSASFYPEISPRSFRTTELVKEFSRQGHDVTLLTVKNAAAHLPFEREYNVTIKDMGALKLPNIDLVRGGRLWILAKRMLRRLLLMCIEYPQIEYLFRVASALRQEKGYDLLISIAVPHPVHWGVALAKTRNASVASTWVADCGDPYMGNDCDSFRPMPYFSFVEKWFCRKVDYLTVPFEGARAGYYEEFHDKIRVIPQGFRFDDSETLPGTYRPNPVPTFAYSGALMPGIRDPRPLLEYLVSQPKDFRFYLYSANSALVTPYLERAQGRIIVSEYIPRSELLKILCRMDFLININNASERQMPSKLIDYYLTGRPVLSLDSGRIDVSEITRFLDGDYSGRYSYEDIDQYRIENVCREFLVLCASGAEKA